MGGHDEAKSPVDETERLALNWAGQLPYDVKAERVNITKFRRRRSDIAGGEWVTMFVKDGPTIVTLGRPSVASLDLSLGITNEEVQARIDELGDEMPSVGPTVDWPDFPETDSLEMPSVSTMPDGVAVEVEEWEERG